MYYAYIRVSTTRQGEHGVSLKAQRDGILKCAQVNHLDIGAWFEEQETAARRGRPVFNQMLRTLEQGQAQGVIIHKIDRGARNLRDWADLGELIDRGINVRFAFEALDVHTKAAACQPTFRRWWLPIIWPYIGRI
jgi:site-specific DNA recombinase